MKLIGWVIVSCSLLGATSGYAQVARIELHVLQSTTLTDQEFLTGQKEGKSVTIAGELRIPKPGTDRLPAVVMVHLSGGISGSMLIEIAQEQILLWARIIEGL